LCIRKNIAGCYLEVDENDQHSEAETAGLLVGRQHTCAVVVAAQEVKRQNTHDDALQKAINHPTPEHTGLKSDNEKEVQDK